MTTIAVVENTTKSTGKATRRSGGTKRNGNGQPKPPGFTPEGMSDLDRAWWRAKIHEAITHERETLKITCRTSGDDDHPLAGTHFAAHNPRLDLPKRIVNGNATVRLSLLEQSMDKLEQGTFGICTTCHNGIELPRLEAVPEAERCLGCQSATERR
ncbi:MAG: TraR/DksA C4-type zinc finger protein [Candidatus Kerfeldbacteria bacterium]|nr:TraR/DksA C4-type zinc finger protein [Candidatus Kerfeldbacteria bacterium]